MYGSITPGIKNSIIKSHKLVGSLGSYGCCRVYRVNSALSSCLQSLGALGALPGAPLALPVSLRLGRKPALMLGGVFTLVGWLFVACSHFVSSDRSGFLALFLMGRLLTGFGGGWAIYCVSVSCNYTLIID